MKTVFQLYKAEKDDFELCFNIGINGSISDDELNKLRLNLADGFIINSISRQSIFSDAEDILEIGPRLNIETPWSSNMVSICKAVGLHQVFRVEKSRRYKLPSDCNREEFAAKNHDRMTECVYSEALKSFDGEHKPEPVYFVPLMEKGPDALLGIPGISMDERDRNFYYDYFVGKHKRNPTIVEIMDLNNANCEHSRHGFFKGKQIIDGQEMPNTLLEMVMKPWKENPGNSVIAFSDNSSGIAGPVIQTIVPRNPGEPSSFILSEMAYDIIFTAETHNFPTGIAPFPGAETGTGGRIRDVQGTGKGGFTIAGTAGYCVGNLHIPRHFLPWEKEVTQPDNLAAPLQVLIDASNGASDYGNKFGEPLIQGFTRSFDLRLDNGERWAYLKPIMFTGGIGQIDHRHVKKEKPVKGMYIVQVGGPAYRVGFGGGAASSKLQGDQEAKLDFNAVQRGDAEMEQKMNRVIRACNEMGDKTLIDVIHDQGAGGPGNVLKELVEKIGGRIGIRKIKVGDPTMSFLEIFVAEYQERNGFLIREENLEKFKAICEREKVNCELLGTTTGDLRFVVEDEDGSTPVDIELSELLGNIPQKTFRDNHIDQNLSPFKLPPETSFMDALIRVLKLPSVGSKRFLTNKVDRTVTGLVRAQQCCGPLQLPVGDVAVVAQSHFDLVGAATAIGEQPIKMLVNPAAGARMAVGEALTNLVGAKISEFENIRCSANWMWAPKLEGEGAALYDAVSACAKAIGILGFAIDGGKDSLSMATRVGGEVVKSPRQLVVSAYCDMSDITKVITPDIKRPGESVLVFIDLAGGKNRLGGSALAQVFGQIGDESPDMDDPLLVRRAFNGVQELIEHNLILSIHDRSDGGLITTLLEMAFAGNCGLDVDIPGSGCAMEILFSEELGLVFECLPENLGQIKIILRNKTAPFFLIGQSTQGDQIKVSCNRNAVLVEGMYFLQEIWEETSYQLERCQMNPVCADEEDENIYIRTNPIYHIPAELLSSLNISQTIGYQPKVAILREEGSNSDREMTSAFYLAGFDPVDVAMSDLLADRVTLESFRGLVAVGGFSYADVPESAKGWAATILFNEKLKKMFSDFYNRLDTFTLGVCNGCQLFALLGWVPYQGISARYQPRFVRNISGRFESRWSMVKVLPSKAILLQGMENLVFGIPVAHGEGRLRIPDPCLLAEIKDLGLAPLAYVDDMGQATEKYPFNPNGSPDGITALCSSDGRHLALMPHPERAFLPWQCHYLPEDIKQALGKVGVSPWFKMFQNAYWWCLKNG